MFSVFAFQLPFSVCLVWFVIAAIKPRKNHSDRLLTAVFALLSITFLSGSNFLFVSPDYKRQVILNLFLQFSSLSVFPVVCFYIRSLYDERHEALSSYLMLLPAILVTTSSLVITLQLGVERSSLLVHSLFNHTILYDALDVMEKSYVIICYRIYYPVFISLLTLSLVYLVARLFKGKFRFGHIGHFIKGQKASFVANIMCLFFVIYFMMWGACVIFEELFLDITSVWSVSWALLSSLVLFLIGFVSAVPPLPGGYVTMECLRHPFSANRQSPGEYLAGIDSGPVADVPRSGYDKIMESFRQAMVTDKCYLDPEMSIDEISRRLGTNRTYVSKLVNIYYGMPFRDYLNKMRIDFAKELMAAEPDAVIEYISVKSGFQSSTQFIRKFKELEGVTPTVWRSSQSKKV